MRLAWIIFVKEIIDALRDRKTLATLVLSTVLVGPLMLVVMSAVISQQETRAERREIWVDGLDRAPELDNFLRRQGMVIRQAPADYRQGLHDFSFEDPVITVAADYAEKLAAGEPPELRVVFDSGNRQSAISVRRSLQLLRAFSREQATLELASRGVSPAVLEPYRVQELDLADQQSRSVQAMAMVPWMVMMAVLLGGLTVALDTTAGERERASLEPLLTNPVPPSALVLGKWLAVASIAMLVAVLSVLSFFPALWLVRSEALLAMFRFGPGEGVAFLLMLLPLAAAVAAVLMLAAVYGRSYKEAQARATFILFAFQMVPLVGILDFSGEKPWHLWVPSLAQQTVMLRVLRGDALEWPHLIVPTLVSLVVTALALTLLSRRIKALAVQ
jgi:sodium transport system permease protein